jgi:site-specific recombinase XerD
MPITLAITFHRHRVSPDGTASLYLRLTIHRRSRLFPLDVRWPARLVDAAAGAVLPRSRRDTAADDTNIILRSALARANEIILYYRLSGQQLTLSRFARDYENQLSKTDFIAYMEAKIHQRRRDRDIEAPTARQHLQTLTKLRAFSASPSGGRGSASILFADFSETWAADFDAHLRRTMAGYGATPSQNSRWAHHKNVKTYLHRAERDQIRFINPYHYFTISSTRGRWRAIFQEDLQRLYRLYRAGTLRPVAHRVLRAFLFACLTGLRVSDLLRLTDAWVIDGILVFVPYKSRKSGRLLKVPLTTTARQLLDAARLDANRPELFYHCEEQAANRILKEIALEAGIRACLHWHVARHTFISLYYQATKDLLAARDFAGHKDVKQTLVYTHQPADQIREKMRPMDDIL